MTCLCFGSIHAYGVLLAPVEQWLGTSRTVASMGYAVAIAALTIGVYLNGRIEMVFGPRLRLIGSGAVAALGLMIAGGSSSSAGLLLGFGLMYGLANGVAYAMSLGIAAAVFYLLLPYTATMTGRVDHVLPGALMLWAIAAYRRPCIAGGLIGLAMGTIYYPVFLLPLWCGFYWERGVRRFALGVATALASLVVALWFTSPDAAVFLGQLRQMFGWIFPNEVSLEGFWALPMQDAVFRLPVLAAFVAMMATLAIWPAPKNLGTLMSCTAAVLLGSQFWKAHNGGLFMAWYLPVLLLVVFRPNLENRVAMLMLTPEWFPRRRAA